MRVTFEELFPIMRPGGVYICEDIINGNEFLAYLAGLAEHLMTYTSTPIAEPGVASGILLPEAGVASAADSLQRAVRAVHLYPFLAVVERTLEPVTDFQPRMNVPSRALREWPRPGAAGSIGVPPGCGDEGEELQCPLSGVTRFGKLPSGKVATSVLRPQNGVRHSGGAFPSSLLHGRNTPGGHRPD